MENISTLGGNRLSWGADRGVRIRRRLRPWQLVRAIKALYLPAPCTTDWTYWVTFAYEQSLYETNAVPGPTGALPLFNGIPCRTWRDLRSEGGTIFTF